VLPPWAKPLWANTFRRGKEMEEGRKEREAAEEKKSRRRERGGTSPGWPQKGENRDKVKREANGRDKQITK